jgi:hypothetical protein
MTDHHKSGWKISQIKAHISGLWPCGLSGHPPFLSLLQSTVMERYSPLKLVGGSHFCGPETGHVQTHTPPPPPPKSSTLDDMMIWSWPLDFQFGWLDREYGFKDHVKTPFISTILNSIWNSWFNTGLALLHTWWVLLLLWTTTKWSINQSPNHQVLLAIIVAPFFFNCQKLVPLLLNHPSCTRDASYGLGGRNMCVLGFLEATILSYRFILFVQEFERNRWF